MGKTALLAIVAFGTLAAYHSINTNRGVAATETELAEHQVKVLSRNASLTGYQQARQALAEDFLGAPSTMEGIFEGTPYGVKITRSGNVSDVLASGVARDAGGQMIPHHVMASIEREAIISVAEEAPPFMNYALLTERDLSLDGNVLGEVYVVGDESNQLNANMHTNGSLYISGNSVDVRGFGSYVNSGSGNPSGALTGSFHPYYNPTGAPTAARATRVEIPAFDSALFTSKVTVDQASSSASLSGTFSPGGTREDPYVWHVTGDLTVTGNTVIDGYVLILVDGSIDLRGNVEVGSSGYGGADESSIALYARDNITFRGNTRTFGQIYVGGDFVVASGTPRIYGSITSLGGAVLSGTPKIYYREASPALTTIFQDPEYRLTLLSYKEW